MKIRSAVLDLLHADRQTHVQTDRHDEANRRILVGIAPINDVLQTAIGLHLGRNVTTNIFN
jgi:hypothetical protein